MLAGFPRMFAFSSWFSAHEAMEGWNINTLETSIEWKVLTVNIGVTK